MFLNPGILGALFALGSSICFAGNRAFASRPLVKSDPQIPTYISLLVGVVITAAATLGAEQGATLVLLTGFTLAIFVAAGVIHFAIGRQMSYLAEKNIGANQAAPVISTQVVYSVLFAILLLGESINLEIGIGATLILIGVFLLEAGTSAAKRGGNVKRGYAAAVITSILFGISPLLIKFGQGIFGYFASATFVAYFAALVFYALTRNPVKIASSIKSLPRYALIYYLISGSLAAIGQLFRFGALNIAPVVIVIPILASHPIFTIILTRSLAKDFEVFHARTVSAIIVVVIGTILVSIASGSAP